MGNFDSFLGDNIEKAIDACRRPGEESATRARVSQLVSSKFCRAPANVGNLRCIGEFGVHHIRTLLTQ